MKKLLQFIALLCLLGSIPMTIIATKEHKPFFYLIFALMLITSYICFKRSKKIGI